MEQGTQGVVYFVGAGWGSPVKIGWASDPHRRLRELQVASPVALVLLAQRPGTKADERELHARFNGSRLMREWFAWSDALATLIRSLAPVDRLTLRDVAEWLRTAPTTILREVRQGRLPCSMAAGDVQFEIAALETWLAELARYGEDGRDGRWRRSA